MGLGLLRFATLNFNNWATRKTIFCFCFNLFQVYPFLLHIHWTIITSFHVSFCLCFKRKTICWRKYKFPSKIQLGILSIKKFQSGWWWPKDHYIWFLIYLCMYLWSHTKKTNFLWEWSELSNELSTKSWLILF